VEVAARVEFEDFYRTHWHDAARWAAAVVGRTDVGEEIAQDVFARLAGRFDGLDNPVGYLRTAVVNGGRSWLRSEGRARAREAHIAPREAGDVDVAATLTLLDRLPERQRLVVVLRYWADWPDEDIANALACPTSTVRSLARRGLDALRKEMQ